MATAKGHAAAVAGGQAAAAAGQVAVAARRGAVAAAAAAAIGCQATDAHVAVLTILTLQSEMPLGGWESHLAHFYDGSLTDVLLEGQQQLVVGLLDAGGLHA